jgi:polyhydroxybutyrate depolymerase
MLKIHAKNKLFLNTLTKIVRQKLQHVHPNKLLLVAGSLFCTFLFAGCTLFDQDAGTVPATSASINAHITAFPIASSGCGKTSEIIPGTTAHESLISGGLTRSYLLYIPTDYRTTRQYPLILNFHRHGSNALKQERMTDFASLANRYGIIVAYPQGVVGPDHRTGWDTGPARNPQTNDLLFVSNLLNHLQSTLCINPDRIYATGFSNGGGMTNELACKLADRIAAFAPVSGAYPQLPGGCDPARAVPILEIHGTQDPIVPYNGSPVKGYPPITQWLQEWTQRDDCKQGPTIFMNTRRVTGERWTGCRDDATLVHYAIHGLGHAWPTTHYIVLRNGQYATSFNATTSIWAFFRDYKLSFIQRTFSASKQDAAKLQKISS